MSDEFIMGAFEKSEVGKSVGEFLLKLENKLVMLETRIANLESGLKPLQKHNDITEEYLKKFETRIAKLESNIKILNRRLGVK